MKLVLPAAFLSFFFLAGDCGGSNQPPSNGIYKLTVASQDSCQPARATGTFQDELVESSPDGGRVGFWVPLDLPEGLSGIQRYDVSLGGTPSDGGYSPCRGSTYQYDLRAVSHDERSLDVKFSQAWNGLAACPRDGGLELSGIPGADCSTVRDLHYELTTPCKPPCMLTQPTPSATLTCSCT